MKDGLNGSLQVALRMRNIYIGTEHLLIAVIDNDDGEIESILQLSGVSLEAVRNKAAELLADLWVPSDLVDETVARLLRIFSMGAHS